MIEVKHQVHSIDDIMRYFIKGFELPPGATILDYQWFYDPRKGMVALTINVTKHDAA